MSEINPQQWAILVYMAGDNNISDRCIDNLKQMQQVGSTENVRVLVQFDPRKKGVRTKRYRISRQGPNGSLDDDAVYTFLEETNTGDPKELEDFLRWGMSENPDARYLVILWGHGTGMDDDKPVEAGGDTLVLRIKSEALVRSLPRPEFKMAVASIGDDENPQDFLSNDDLKIVFSSLREDLKRQVDIIGFDSCLMSMAEVYYQLRGTVKLAVGAEGLTPSSSWPYHRILAALNEEPGMEAENLADLIVRSFVAHYSDYEDTTVDLSVCNLEMGEQLGKVVGQLAQELTHKLTSEEVDSAVRTGVKNAVHIAHFHAQQYYGDAYVDLFDFCQLLYVSSNDGGVRKACEEVMGLLDKNNKLFVLTSEHTGEDTYPYGLSIYFPWNNVNEVYGKLEFPRDSGWLNFLLSYADSAAPERLK